MSDNKTTIDAERMQKIMDSTLKIIAASQFKGDSYEPYFCEKHAIQVKTILDAIAESGKPMFIPRDQDGRSVTIGTLSNQISQASRYLRKFMDKEGKYADLLDNRLSIRKRQENGKPTGLVISPKKIPGNLKGYLIEDWRPKFLEFIDSAGPRETFQRLGLRLDEADLKWIDNALMGLDEQFVKDISVSGICLVKL